MKPSARLLTDEDWESSQFDPERPLEVPEPEPVPEYEAPLSQPPMVQAPPDAQSYVPPELRVKPAADSSVADALAEDEDAQKAEDVRNLLYAAFSRTQPNLRKLGTPKAQQAQARVLAAEKAKSEGANAEKSNPRSPRNVALRAMLSQMSGQPVPEGLTEANLTGPLAGAFSSYVANRRDVRPVDEERRALELEKLSAEIARLKREPEAKPIIPDEYPDAAREELEKKFGLTPGALKGVKPSAVAPFKPTPKPKAAKPVDTDAKSVSGLPDGWFSKTATTTQRQKFAGVVVASNKATAITKRLRALVAEAGAGRVIPGALSTRIKSEAEKLRVEVKNVAELGALSGPDMSIIDAIVANPANVSSLAKHVPSQLDAVDAWGEDSISATADGFNIKRRGASGKVMVKKGDEVLEIDSSDVGAAQADGYEVLP